MEKESKFLELSLKRFRDIQGLRRTVTILAKGDSSETRWGRKTIRDFKPTSSTIEDFLKELEEIVQATK